MVKSSAIQGVGRRKTSVARVYLNPGTGAININGKPYEEYLGRKTLNMIIRQPLKLLDIDNKYDIKVNVSGGGLSGQAGAIRLGISNALVKNSAEDRPALKKAKFLTRDPREVERKKYGRHKARKRPQFSKR